MAADEKEMFEAAKRCPGASDIVRPTLVYVKCKNCGNEIEMFTDEFKTTCEKCGATVFREETPSCIDWCAHAKECIGEEKYKQIKGTKS